MKVTVTKLWPIIKVIKTINRKTKNFYHLENGRYVPVKKSYIVQYNGFSYVTFNHPILGCCISV